ncbi:MAG: divergent polysaccharide deacetylase family protein [Pseudomonadota bacterium]
MSVTATDDLVEDAEIEGLPQPSRFWSFVKGALLGVIASGAAAIALTLSNPLPDNLPGVGTVRIDQGADSAPTDPIGVTESAAEESANVSVQAGTEADTAQPETPEQGVEIAIVQTPVAEEAETSSEDAAADDSEDVAPIAPASASDDGDGSATAAPDIAEAPSDPASDPEPVKAEGDIEVSAIAPPDDLAEAVAQPEPEPLVLAGPALNVNARSFDAPGSASLLAVVLEDAGNGSISLDKLGLLTMPLTLSIRPDSAASVELAKAARAARHEVLTHLPVTESVDGGPGDLSRVVQRSLAMLPEAVGVTTSEDAPILSDAAALRTVLEPLADHGFAWIDPAGAGRPAASLSGDAGVVYSESERFVGAGASSDEVFQNLEDAAFLARQKGTAIIYVTSSTEALTALLRWGLEKDRRPVWFAPISAVIKRRAADG